MFSYTKTKVLTVLVAGAAAFMGGVSAQNLPLCSRQYTVQSGDVCDAISAAQNVSTYQLASVNNATINADCSNLFVGEILCLGIVGKDCTTTHVVAESGDTCFSIEQDAGIESSTLLANNPNVNGDCSNIYPGEVLCVSSKVFV